MEARTTPAESPASPCSASPKLDPGPGGQRDRRLSRRLWSHGESGERLGAGNPTDQPSVPGRAVRHLWSAAGGAVRPSGPGSTTLTLVDADQGLINPADVICGFEQLQAAMIRVVGSAAASLAIVGSRSRDRAYLATIEEVLGMRSRLIHWRVLVGPPTARCSRTTLFACLQLRDPADRLRDADLAPRHGGGSGTRARAVLRGLESQAMVTIPSLTAASNFDSGILLAHPLQARALVEHAKQLYAGSTKLETPTTVQALPVLR